MSRDGSTPAELARLLTDTGRGDSEITVLEQLGGPAERRRSSTAAEWAARPPGDVDDLNVIAVRYLPDGRRFAVLPDDAFAHDGQITKQSMRAVTLAALAPRPGELSLGRRRRLGQHRDRVVPQRCGLPGSGFRARRTASYPHHRQRDGIRRQGRGAFRRPGSLRFRATAVGDLRRRRADPAGPARRVLRATCRRESRLVANAVTAESEAVLTQWYSRMGGELRRYQHYRGEPLGKFTGWRPAMPVTQWVVTKE